MNLFKILTKDHNAENPAEKKRLANEHRGEHDLFSDDGTIKDYLRPTRCFGQLCLKNSIFNGPPYVNGDRSRGIHFPTPFTPPYITAEPQLTYHLLRKGEEAFLIIGKKDFLSYLKHPWVVCHLSCRNNKKQNRWIDGCCLVVGTYEVWKHLKNEEVG